MPEGPAAPIIFPVRIKRHTEKVRPADNNNFHPSRTYRRSHDRAVVRRNDRSLRCSDCYDHCGSDRGDSGNALFSTVLPILGLLWVFLPDLVPGPLDDLMILLMIPFLNPKAASGIIGGLGRGAVILFALLWIIFPDLVPGPVDDALMTLLMLYMIPKPKN